MNVLIETARLVLSAPGDYAVRMAQSSADVRAAQALRFAVFNLELHEGLSVSFLNGLDADPFDAVCDHLVVEHCPTREIIGTYRMQTGAMAADHLGYYSAQEFDFSVFEPIRATLLELGRACIRADHRNLSVLSALWQGIADYAGERGVRYLCGCSSLTTVDAPVGAAAYSALAAEHLAPLEWRTRPTPQFACDLDRRSAEPVKIPKLLRAYLGLGAWICGPPALDRSFGTIDFLTLLDLNRLTPSARNKFLR